MKKKPILREFLEAMSSTPILKKISKRLRETQGYTYT
jgi:hypothetical protein